MKAAYNHAEHLRERTMMMQQWANYLDSLCAGAEVGADQESCLTDGYD